MGLPIDERYCYMREPFGTTKGRSFPHTGDDWARKKLLDKPLQEYPDVLAVHSGVVMSANWHANAGNRIIIRYNHGVYGVYGHLAKMVVKAGTRVTEGQVIGLLGGTGKVTGPHLHYSQYTDERRALSGIVQYWEGVKWASIDAWAAASGLQRPAYKTKAVAPVEKPAEVAPPAPEPITLPTGDTDMLMILEYGGEHYLVSAAGRVQIETARHRDQLDAALTAWREAIKDGKREFALGKYNGGTLVYYLDKLNNKG